MSSTTQNTATPAGEPGNGPPPRGPIPTPPEFPVAWEEAGDEQGFWTTDALHFPTPLAPLTDSFIRALYLASNAGFARLDLPLRMVARRINTYHYLGIVPLPLPPEEVEAMGRRAQEKIGALMGQLLERWQNDWLPAIERELAAWERFDLAAADAASFRAHVAETMARYERLFAIHFEIVAPMLMAMSSFTDLYRDLFGGDDAFDALRLVQGFENETLRANRAGWVLGRSAAASSTVRHLLEATPSPDVVAALGQSDAGRSFLAALRGYLAEFGRRGSDFIDLDRPSWLEDPTPVIDVIKGYLTGPGADPEEERARLAASREAHLAATRARLQGYPRQAVEQFEFALKAAQEATILSEDHGYYIDWMGLYEVRRVMLEAGRRLALAGAIASPDDVFMLYFDELLAALDDPAGNWAANIPARRAEIAHFRQIAPPPAIGTMPPGAPPDDPVNRAMIRFFGGPPPASDTPGVIRGNAGSPGIVTGRAVVARSLGAAGRLRQGDILVAETTAPPWTPLFAVAAAVVTDTGGVLCHSAVVAREYGIPAVVGTGMATKVIPDGALIEVDGRAGTIRLLE
ncbi:MAG TPA: PEP-utilizing enzyme [Thermomicrobiales bacterium]|nr:PEP-utilizing enzyme [Thermomicrobiales bacterium]